jgi:hypothetical protein
MLFIMVWGVVCEISWRCSLGFALCWVSCAPGLNRTAPWTYYLSFKFLLNMVLDIVTRLSTTMYLLLLAPFCLLSLSPFTNVQLLLLQPSPQWPQSSLSESLSQPNMAIVVVVIMLSSHIITTAIVVLLPCCRQCWLQSMFVVARVQV